MKAKLFGSVLFAWLAAASPALAQQQDALALDRFNPSWAGDRFFGTASPFAAGDLGLPHAMLVVDYAHNPLVLRTGAGDEIGAVVQNQLFLHLNATYAWRRRLAFNFDLPLAVAQGGEDPAVGGATFGSPTGAAIGDLRLGLRFRVWGEHDGAYQIGVGGDMWLPTGSGDPGSFVGTGSVRGLPKLMVGGVLGRFLYGADVGVEISGQQTFANTTQGTRVSYGAAGGMLLGDQRNIQVGAEFLGALVVDDVEKRTVNLELLFGGKYRFMGHYVAGLGVGPGMARGVGTPDVRFVASFAFSPNQEAPADTDRDGILDDKDACPKVAGVPSTDPLRHGCPPPPPPPDSDGDGIVDDLDACRTVPGVASPEPEKNGCPPPKDSDGDGVVDDSDACPQVAGVATADPKTNGCPPDGDGDGVLDKEDACPTEAGVATADPKTNGCPPPADKDGDGVLDKDDHCPDQAGKPSDDPEKSGCPVVIVTKEEIKILQRIEFETGKAVIQKESLHIVDAVAEVLKSTPAIAKLQVQGHTDNQGSKFLNKNLSQRRAEAVMKALVARGIDKRRVVFKGFGMEVPIGDNATPEGRQQNRRVQFVILERKD